MSIPMSKEEIELTLLNIERNNEEGEPFSNDRVVPRIVAYMLANIDDFMECYEDDDST